MSIKKILRTSFYPAVSRSTFPHKLILEKNLYFRLQTQMKMIPQMSITTVSMWEACGAMSLNRAWVCKADASCVTTRDEMTLFAKCKPKASSRPSSHMATNPSNNPIRIYCGMATQKPKRSTSGLEPWSRPKANPVSNRATHLYLKSMILPCIK